MYLAEHFRNDPDYLTIAAGENIFREGAPANSMYVLLEGTAEILIGGAVVETAGPVTLLGEMALIDEGTRAATVRAVRRANSCPLTGSVSTPSLRRPRPSPRR